VVVQTVLVPLAVEAPRTVMFHGKVKVIGLMQPEILPLVTVAATVPPEFWRIVRFRVEEEQRWTVAVPEVSVKCVVDRLAVAPSETRVVWAAVVNRVAPDAPVALGPSTIEVARVAANKSERGRTGVPSVELLLSDTNSLL
jgi:hypothetical protein